MKGLLSLTAGLASLMVPSTVTAASLSVGGEATNACFEDIALVDERTLQITYRKDKVNAGDVLASLTSQGRGIVDVRTRGSSSTTRMRAPGTVASLSARCAAAGCRLTLACADVRGR